MQETPGAQSGWERGAPGQEQVRVSPKQGGPLPSPAVSSSSTSPVMKGPSHTCRLSQWDSRGETSGGGPGRVCVRLQQDPAPTCTIPSRTSHPVLHQWLAQSREARLQQTKQWPGQAPGCAALLGLPCRRSAGHLSAASLPPPSEAAALFEGRNGVTPTLSPHSLCP